MKGGGILQKQALTEQDSRYKKVFLNISKILFVENVCEYLQSM